MSVIGATVVSTFFKTIMWLSLSLLKATEESIFKFVLSFSSWIAANLPLLLILLNCLLFRTVGPLL